MSNETKGWCKAAHTAGLIRAAEICKSKHENMDSKLNYVAGWLDAEAAIRKEAGEMAHDDIPEDLQQSYPCECGGNIVKKGVVWKCDTCRLFVS